MKSLISIFTVFLFLFCFSAVSFAQDFTPEQNRDLKIDYNAQTQDQSGFGIITALPNSNSSSTFGRAPNSSTRYQRCYYFISEAEMLASGYPAGNITSLGFNYSAATLGAGADTFKVYFENGPATFVDKGSDWTVATSTMTLVHTGQITVPSAPGTVDYTLSNPGAFSYTGSGLWVAFEYQNVNNTLGATNTALCNTSIGAALRNMGTGSNVALSNTMTSFSSFRPETRLGYTPPDCDIAINNLNPLGTISPGCNPLTVAPKVNIANNGMMEQTSISVRYEVPSLSYDQTVSGLTLSSAQNMDVNFPNTLVLDPNSPGLKAVTVTVNSTCNSGAEVYTLNTDFTVSAVNANFGGPVFGYYWSNSTSGASCAPDQPIYYWEDTTGSTSLIVDGVDVSGGLRTGTLDDGYFSLGGILGGDFFRYAGVDYDSFFISTNGIITMTRANNTQSQLTAFTPLAVPDVNAPRPGIFPFWKDLNFGDTDVPVNRLSYKVVPGKLIITYDNAPVFGAAAAADEYVTFQVILETSPVPIADGIIITQFNQDLTGAGFLVIYYDQTLPTHTIGIQNLAGDEAIQYRRGNPVVGGPMFGSNMALSFGSNENALPVELASFTSSVSGRDVTLNWATASELNNSGFDVERSSNGTWTKVANVSGNGTTTSPQSYTYTDRNVATGSYSYRLKQVDFNGNFEYFNLSSEVSVGVPSNYALSQNYPNPFNPSTRINYDLPTDAKVSIKLFDMSGKEVMTLVNENKTAGYYSVTFNGANLSSGIYFYTISTGDFVSTKKMTLIK